MKIREVGIVLANAILGGNLESLSSISNPRAVAYYHSECRFLYRCLFPKKEFIQKPVWKLFEADQVPVVIYSDAAEEWLRPVGSFTVDLVSMCMLCQILKPKVVLEIGTLRGSGALHWAGNSPEANVYTLDLPSGGAPALALTEMDRHYVRSHFDIKKMSFDGRPEADRIHCLYGDSAKFDFSFLFGRVDLIFIDGAHSYEYVRSDTLRTVECAKPGSVIAWHDYGRVGFNGVSKWLHEYSKQGMKIYRVPGGSLAYARI
jgi:predicted O-methyltransferase YrrM